MVRLTRLSNEFYNSEKAGGLVLIFATILSLALANSPAQKEIAVIAGSVISGVLGYQWLRKTLNNG